MSDEKSALTGKLYLVRHGKYEDNRMKRLSDFGREQIRKRAEEIKEEITTFLKEELYNVGLFSSSYPRALDSILEIGNVLNLSDPRIGIDPSFYGSEDNPDRQKKAFEILNSSHNKIYIAVGHQPLLEKFPKWFLYNYHPHIKLDDFNKKFNNDYAAGVFIDFQTGEVRDLSRPREQQVIVPKTEVPKVVKQPTPVIIAPKPAIPSVPVQPKPEPRPFVPYVARQYPPMAPKGEGEVPDDCDLPF